MLKKSLTTLYNSALLFILTFANLLIITVCLYLIKISITVFNLPLAFILSVVELYFIKKEKIKDILVASIITIVIFLISIFISGNIYDKSFDGNAYHKEAIGLLKNGWNPTYGSLEDFGKKSGLSTIHYFFVEPYPKATWIYGANIYKLTNNIETAKSFNLIFLFVAVTIVIYLINKYSKQKKLALIMGLAVGCFPIMWQQILSLYVDGFMGYILLLTIIYMYLLTKEENNKEYLFIIGSLLIILINIKYTGLMYGGIFCLGYYIYYFVNKIKSKEYNNLLKFTFKFVTIVLVGILLVGSNSYVKNVIDHKNPLYPLIGKDKIDIMTELEPASFENKSALRKSIISLFSYTANIGRFNNQSPHFKIPFTVNKYELEQISEDTRIGGFGVLFGGIFIISMIIIGISFLINLKNKNYDILIMFGIPIVIILGFMAFVSDGWWARYSPQIFFISLIALYLVLKNDKKIINLIGYGLTLLIIINTLLCGLNLYKGLRVSKEAISVRNEIKNKKIYIEPSNEYFTGLYYNFEDLNCEYTVVPNGTLKNKKYFISDMVGYEIIE